LIKVAKESVFFVNYSLIQRIEKKMKSEQTQPEGVQRYVEWRGLFAV